MKISEIYQSPLHEQIPNDEIQEFLYSLTADDVGMEEFDGYTVHYEGFSDWCQEDALERCNLPPDDPRHLSSYDAIYDEVVNDFREREGGKQPVDSGLVGDDDYPIVYAVFRKSPKSRKSAR